MKRMRVDHPFPYQACNDGTALVGLQGVLDWSVDLYKFVGLREALPLRLTEKIHLRPQITCTTLGHE